MSVRHLIPDPLTGERSYARFTHQDLAAFAPGQLWAECVTLEAALASAIARQVRPRLISAWPTFTTDHEWMLARVGALRCEMRRRGHPEPEDRLRADTRGKAV